jgi:predicted small lipoprotein YifL
MILLYQSRTMLMIHLLSLLLIVFALTGCGQEARLIPDRT